MEINSSLNSKFILAMKLYGGNIKFTDDCYCWRQDQSLFAVKKNDYITYDIIELTNSSRLNKKSIDINPLTTRDDHNQLNSQNSVSNKNYKKGLKYRDTLKQCLPTDRPLILDELIKQKQIISNICCKGFIHFYYQSIVLYHSLKQRLYAMPRLYHRVLAVVIFLVPIAVFLIFLGALPSVVFCGLKLLSRIIIFSGKILGLLIIQLCYCVIGLARIISTFADIAKISISQSNKGLATVVFLLLKTLAYLIKATPLALILILRVVIVAVNAYNAKMFTFIFQDNINLAIKSGLLLVTCLIGSFVVSVGFVLPFIILVSVLMILTIKYCIIIDSQVNTQMRNYSQRRGLKGFFQEVGCLSYIGLLPLELLYKPLSIADVTTQYPLSIQSREINDNSQISKDIITINNKIKQEIDKLIDNEQVDISSLTSLRLSKTSNSITKYCTFNLCDVIDSSVVNFDQALVAVVGHTTDVRNKKVINFYHLNNLLKWDKNQDPITRASYQYIDRLPAESNGIGMSQLTSGMVLFPPQLLELLKSLESEGYKVDCNEGLEIEPSALKEVE